MHDISGNEQSRLCICIYVYYMTTPESKTCLKLYIYTQIHAYKHYACIYIYTYIYVRIYIHTYSTCVHACIYTYILYMHVHIHENVYTVTIYVYMYIYIHIYMNILKKHSPNQSGSRSDFMKSWIRASLFFKSLYCSNSSWGTRNVPSALAVKSRARRFFTFTSLTESTVFCSMLLRPPSRMTQAPWELVGPASAISPCVGGLESTISLCVGGLGSAISASAISPCVGQESGLSWLEFVIWYSIVASWWAAAATARDGGLDSTGVVGAGSVSPSPP